MKKALLRLFLPIGLMAGLTSCTFLQVDKPQTGFLNPNRISNVEKAWMARNVYDVESNELRPYYRGMRWGAVRTFNKKDTTLASKEWWVRNNKVGDLKDPPRRSFGPVPAFPVLSSDSAVAGGGRGRDPSKPPVYVPPGASPAAAGTLLGGPGGTPAADGDNVEVFGGSGGASMPVFATGEEIPDLPTPPANPGNAGGLIDSPFVDPVPAPPVDPAPGGGDPFPAPPVDPAPGGGDPFPAPPAPGVNPGGAAPDPGVDNPFGAPPPDEGNNPFGAPPPDEGNNPFGAPPPPPDEGNPPPANPF